MPMYIALATFTDQGIKNVKESGARYDAFKAMLEQKGGKAHAVFMTMGAYDMIAIYELPSDEVAADVALKLAAAGNVRTQTLKAFDEATYKQITAGV